MFYPREHNFVLSDLFRLVFVWIIKMLEYDRIDISEGIDINKTNKSKNVWFAIIGIF